MYTVTLTHDHQATILNATVVALDRSLDAINSVEDIVRRVKLKAELLLTIGHSKTFSDGFQPNQTVTLDITKEQFDAILKILQVNQITLEQTVKIGNLPASIIEGIRDELVSVLDAMLTGLEAKE